MPSSLLFTPGCTKVTSLKSSTDRYRERLGRGARGVGGEGLKNFHRSLQTNIGVVG